LLNQQFDADFARYRRLYWSFIELALRPWVIGHFRSLRHVYGTIFHVSTSSRHLPLESLKIVWRLIYFLLFFLNLYIPFVKCLRGDFLSFLTLLSFLISSSSSSSHFGFFVILFIYVQQMLMLTAGANRQCYEYALNLRAFRIVYTICGLQGRCSFVVKFDSRSATLHSIMTLNAVFVVP